MEKLENSGIQKEMEELRQQVNELQQHSRNENLEVQGIACLSNENMLDKLKDVAKLLDVA